LDQAKEIDAELVMAADPDADRVGIAVKDHHGEWTLLNGNQTGTLIINYMLDAWQRTGRLKGDEYIVKTIVTSNLIDRIADHYGVTCYNTLTGFKYIGQLMTELEDRQQFIAGGEESYGYLIGDHVRDKDAVVSAVIIAEMAAYYKDNGSSLYEALLAIYKQYGYFRERLVSVYKKGREGAREIQEMLARYRQHPPAELDGSRIVVARDYKSGEEKNLANQTTSDLDFPSSNVRQFMTEDETVVSILPSSTEPKIKFYCSVNTGLDDQGRYEERTE